MAKSKTKAFDVEFPIHGIVRNTTFARQPRLTCVDANNVVSYDPLTDRPTGGRRPGMSKYFDGTLTPDIVRDGTTVNTTTAVTGLVRTSDLVPGLAVLGAGIPADTVIASITSATAIVLSAAATASATVELTFRLSPSYSVQDISQLSASISGAVNKDVGTTDSHFVYALASGSGCAIAKGTDLSAVDTLSETSGTNLIFRISCWDDEGNCYVGMQNTSDGVCNIYSFTSSGVFRWSIENYFDVGNGTTDRCINGMVAIKTVNPNTQADERHLYVAFNNSAGSFSWIYKLKTEAIIEGSRVVRNTMSPNLSGGAWLTSEAVPGMIFSTASHNCLAACGSVLGIDNKGGNNFIIAQTKPPEDFLHIVPYLGGSSGSNTQCKVVSDRDEFFYVIPSSTMTPTLLKIGVNGSMNGKTYADWVGSTGSFTFNPTLAIDLETPISLVYDRGRYDGGAPRLLVLFSTAGAQGALRIINQSTGVFAGGISPPTAGAEDHNEIDSDDRSTFVLFRNADASNNVRRLNTTPSETPTHTGSLPAATVTHTGASMNKAVAGQLPTDAEFVSQITFLAVSGGNLKMFTPAGPTIVTGGNAMDRTAINIFGASLDSKCFYVDGKDYYVFTPAIAGGTLSLWTASEAGTIPRDSGGKCCPLIEAWNGRLVLAGIDQNWYMTKKGAPLNFDYGAVPPIPTRAFSSSSSSEFGQIGQRINCIIPMGEDLCVFGLDHGIAVMNGDPGEGGGIESLSDTIGIAKGRPWCKDENGRCYFFANHGAVYRLVVGGTHEMISGQIKQELEGIDLRTNSVRMAWDVIGKCLWVIIFPHDRKRAATHWRWEARKNAWFPFTFDDPNFNASAIFALDGGNPNDRTIAFGSRDGYIRVLDYSSNKDDTKPIPAYVLMGPFTDDVLNRLMFKCAYAILGSNSGDVDWDVYVGNCPEAALASMYDSLGKAQRGVAYGTWGAGRNDVSLIQRSGHAAYLKVSTNDYFAIESIRIEFEAESGEMRRGII